MLIDLILRMYLLLTQCTHYDLIKKQKNFNKQICLQLIRIVTLDTHVKTPHYRSGLVVVLPVKSASMQTRKKENILVLYIHYMSCSLHPRTRNVYLFTQ